MILKPAIDNVSASGLGGTGSENLSWSHTIGNLGKNGLIIVGAIGREESGEQNPEEINQITFNGVVMTKVLDANRNETGVTMWELHGDSVPAAGTYTVNVNYKDSPKQAEKKRGVCASFRNVQRLSPQEQSTNATADSGQMSLSLTPQSKNALFVGVYGWRVGFAYTLNTGQVEAVTNRGDNSAGVSILYQIVPLPVSTTLTITPNNSETEGMIIATFKGNQIGGGGLIAIL